MPREPRKPTTDTPTDARKPGQRRAGLGANPLDAIMPDAPAATPAKGAASSAAPGGGATARAGKRRKVSLYLSAELVERMRNAAVHLAGPPEYLTLTDLGERAIDSEVTRLERKHNGGQPFPQRPDELRGGRPIGS